MAIHAITGVMGSGKSYEAVSEKIAPALRDNEHRRVVTNIEGLNLQAFADYTGRPLADVERRLVCVSYERITEPGFWYDPEAGAVNTVVQPGDLVVLDEVWRYYNRGTKIPDDAMRFFRMHRHYAHPDSGLTCDVVLINQALRGLHADIRDIVEVQFSCRKLKVLGRPENYQVFMIEGGERKASHRFMRKYRSEVFPLYKSHTVQGAKEEMDQRQNMLAKPFFKFVVPLALLAILGGLWTVFHYFGTLGKKPGAPEPAASALSAPAPAGAPAAPGAAPAPAVAPAGASTASQWRVVASYQVGSLPVVLLTDNSGRFRTLTAASFARGAADDIQVVVPPDESLKGKATPWTGPAPSFTSSSSSQPSAQVPGVK